MLPTNQKAGTLWLTPINQLIHTHVSGVYKEKYKPQHIYISFDDKIKEDDWALNPTGYIVQCNKFNLLSIQEHWKKIIATTDSLLTGKGLDSFSGTPDCIPSPSQSFIEKYVSEYNKGNVITDVLVEYYQKGNLCEDDSLCEGTYCEDVLKVNHKDNTITIKKLKDSWSRDEVIGLLHKLISSYQSATYKRTSWSFDTNKWIKENL